MPKHRLIGKETLLKQKKLIDRLISVSSREGLKNDELLLRGLSGLLSTIADCERDEEVIFTITD